MLIKNVRLIPELSGGRGGGRYAVRITDGRIREIFDEKLKETVPQADEKAFDCEGKTLLPGLIDAHTHISGLRDFAPGKIKKPMQYMVDTALFAQRYLDYGFTTVRDCGTAARVNSGVRDCFAQGLAEGPRIVSCGLIIMPTEIECTDLIDEMYQFEDGTDEARKATRREIAEQADFIKVMVSGSALDRHGVPDQSIMTREELQTIVDTAAVKNLYVAAHAHGDGAINTCIETGVRTIEHGSFISRETVDSLLMVDNCWVIPTVSAMYQNPETTPEAWQFLVKKLNEMLNRSSECLRYAYENGVEMGFGTDSCPGMDQYENGIEFRLRKEKCGMKDEDILIQATKNNAKALGLEDRIGEIKEGMVADLVLVDGKPDEDISVMYNRPEAVWLSGKLVRGEARSV